MTESPSATTTGRVVVNTSSEWTHANELPGIDSRAPVCSPVWSPVEAALIQAGLLAIECPE